MMKNALSIFSLAILGPSVLGYQQQASNHKEAATSRRNILASAASAVAAATLGLAVPRSAQAVDEDPLVPVYFGVGVRLLCRNVHANSCGVS
jgi:hypothetical protein